jgi:N6-L-threonylcarbamoyladenine synthase
MKKTHHQIRADIARGFQDALIGSLVEKTFRAADAFGRDRVVLGGGVACNSALVSAMRERVREIGAQVYAPSPRLATDNAAMIARAGFHHYYSRRARVARFERVREPAASRPRRRLTQIQ